MPTFSTIILGLSFVLSSVAAIAAGTLKGTTSGTIDTRPLAYLTVSLLEAGKQTSTDDAGNYQFSDIPAGTYTLKVTGVGWNPVERSIEVVEGETTTENVSLEESANHMGEVIVYGASRVPEKLTNAPAAISVVTPLQIENAESHGSVAKTMEHLPGVDVVQNGANDFSINSRGFNNSITRRQLVLIDGRDPSTPMINLNEWNSVSSLLGDIQSIEVVRGPGSALYGWNAYNGVINIRTNDPKDVLGTRVTLTGGEWETYKGAIRHAGEFGDFAYKISLGASSQYNYSVVSRQFDTTKPNNGLEYAGLAHDIRPIDDDEKRPFAYVGTARLDYYLNPNQRFVLEGGYSNSGNEFYVNQTGRILIQEVERPFARLAYNSGRFNAQASWQKRFTPKAQVVFNAPATSGEDSDVLTIDAQFNDQFLDNKLRLVLGAQAEYVNVITDFDYELDESKGERQLAFLDPDPQSGTFTGVYAQGEYLATKALKFVGAVRVDATSFEFPIQVSPKAAIVFEPIAGQSFRVTYNRSWLRPSFSDLYRKSPAGRPADLAQVESNVDSITSALVGETVQSNLGLSATTPVWNLGNVTIEPEVANSFDIGYRGTITDELFVDINGYWNRRTDLISNPLGGLAPNVYAPIKSNTGNAAYDAIADSVLQDQMVAIGQDPARLSYYQNSPSLVIVPTNIAVVDEFGVEVSATYFLTHELSINANYAYLDVAVSDNAVPENRILPNTSRHRINTGIEYQRPGVVDGSINLRYVEGFDWIAGFFEGHVPSYAVVNISAGYFVLPQMRLGINVFNALDRAHYEIFGGTILRRQVTGSVSYHF